MFRFMVVCGLAACLLALSVKASALEIKLAIADDGKVEVIRDGQTVWSMHPGIFAPGWKMISEARVEDGYPKMGGGEDKTILRFALAPPEQEGVVNVTVTVAPHKESADFDYVFEVPKTLKLNNVFIRTRFSVASTEGKTLRVGNQEVKLPVGEYQKGQFKLFAGDAGHVTFPIPDILIELTTDPNTHCSVQDLREWNTNDFEVCLNFLAPAEAQEVAAGTKFEKRVTLQVPGLTSSSLVEKH